MIKLIAAVSIDGVYGLIDGRLPWSLQKDMAHFKKQTMGSTIIMGRATWESIGRRSPLPGRQNIVVTGSNPKLPDGVIKANSIEDALRLSDRKDQFLIGGRNIWRDGIAAFAEELLVTEVLDRYDSQDALQAPELIAPGHHSSRVFVRESLSTENDTDQITGRVVKLHFAKYTLFFK